MSAQQTPRERLDALIEYSLRQAEQKAKEGEPVSSRELNGLRRLIDAQETDATLERLRGLTAG